MAILRGLTVTSPLLSAILEDEMPPHITDSKKRYRLRSCPHCGGSLYWDEEEKEWRCLNCGRSPERPISTDNNSISGKKIPISTTETPSMSAKTPTTAKGRRPFIPARGPEGIYKGHSIDGIWWPPGKITFRRRQMLFLIKNLPELREGHWPADPAGSGYYEIPAGIAAEIEDWLEKCGIDGLILLAIECWGESEASLAKYLRIPPWSIKKRAKRALRYISGWERKRQSYKESLSHKRG